jgi:hypothetical protein
VDPDPSEISVTHLAEAAIVDPGGDRRSAVDGTVEEQVGRDRGLAEAGVPQTFVGFG